MNNRILLIGLITLCQTSTAVWSADSKQPVTDQEQKSTQVEKPVSPQADGIPWQSLNGGGAMNMSSTIYKVSGSLSQSGIGEGASTNHKARLGFWPGACAARPGDANASDDYTLGDAIAIVNYVFNKAGCVPLPTCWLSGLLCRGDWNGSGTVTLGDAIQGVNYIFNKQPGGPWNALPVGACCLP
ncbi:MAG: hypothetical protein A2142_01625 [candidate division Zixibacteria bacterium RBG_16_48_11]|nr:MAG: hypothetical protein A2142_01625 [candidate division Zixibacteria bacterium RBG_16_48_11]